MSIGEASIGLNLGTAQLDIDVRKAEQILNKIGRGVIANGKQAEKAIQELSAAGVTSVDRLQRSFNTLNIKTGMDIENEKRKITAAFEQIKNSGVASAHEIERAHVAMKSKLDSVGGSINNTTSLFAKLGPAAMGAMAGFSIQQAISQLHAAGMAAERLRNSFEAATGSAAKGMDEFKFARAEANRLGLDLLTTSDAYLKLTAAARGTALEGQNTRDIFSAVSGAGRSLGLSAEQSEGALLAISQMMSKGTVQAEELRGQLGERLPGAFNIAARAMGVTTAELGKMLEGGKVISEDFLPKFAVELAKTFPPGEKAMSGMTAETMRLKTAWYELKTTVMEGGGESMFTKSIKGMKDLVVEADTFYGRMSSAYGLLKDFAKNPMNPNLGGTGTAKLPPVTQTDMMLLNTDYGLSGGRVQPNFQPDFGTLAKREYSVDFGASLTRDNAPEAATTKASTTRTRTPRAEKPVDLLKARILRYQKDMETLAAIKVAEWDAELSAGNFDSSAFMATNGTSTGGRYKKSGSYSLIGPGINTVSQTPVKPIDPNQATVNAERVSAFNSSMDSNIKNSNGDNYGAAKDDLLKDQADREKSISKMLADEVMTVEEADAAKIKSNEEYAAAKKRLDADTAKQALSSLGDSLSSLGNTMMQGNKEQFEAGKKMAIAGATVSMTLGAVQAFTAMSGIPYVGPALGAIAAAAVIAQGVANIANIESQHYEGRALGGPVNAGQTYIVNENRATQGPEYFTPSVSGTITPANKMGGSNTQVTQVIQMSPGLQGTVQAELYRMMPLIRSQAVSAVKQAQRQGPM